MRFVCVDVPVCVRIANDDCPGGAGTKGDGSNRGACVDGVNTHSCNCDAGYSGAGPYTCGSDGAFAGVACTACAAGTYSESGASECTPCPANTYSNVTGATTASV